MATRNNEDHTFDLVVAGTGAAGMTAAVTGALRGLSVVVLEKTPYYGGTTAFSGAVAWIPGNHVLRDVSMGWSMPKVGLADTADKGREYLKDLVGPTVTDEQIDAYLREGPRMLLELESSIGLGWQHWPFPDYFAERPGGIAYGRSVEPKVFDATELGPELENLRPQSPAFGIKGVALTGMEALNMASGMGDARGPLSLAIVAARTLRARVRGRTLLANGQSLLAQMRLALRDREVPLWLSTPVTELLTEGDGGQLRVVGVRAIREGRPVTIRASRGVVLATGGFARSQKMRERFLPGPTDANWSLVPEEGQDGDGLDLGESVGAALELTGKAWGFPTVILPNRQGHPVPRMALWERLKPGAIVVDGDGQRYFDEGITYEETWKMMYAKAATGAKTIPSWMIFDARAKRKYAFFGIPPAVPFPRWWTKNGPIHRADSLRELAQAIDMPEGSLDATVQRYNELAREGHDDDFGRGDTAWARFWGDGRATHPNLGPLEHGPYYAVPIWPGDLSTKGGILVDDKAQVLRQDRTPIPGLFACGNTTASIMGDTYPGGGGTIGPAMVLGYIAANELALRQHASPSGVSRADPRRRPGRQGQPVESPITER